MKVTNPKHIEWIDIYVSNAVAIKELEQCQKDLRSKIEGIIDIGADENIDLITDESLLSFSKEVVSLVFNYDIEQYLIETGLHNTLIVSSTECKKKLTPDQLKHYFREVTGSRRLTTKQLT